MAREKGLLDISANFEPLTASPLDSRMRVPLYSDLYNSSTFGVYAYAGMIVSVYNDGTNSALYRLKNLPSTTPSNWEKVGTGVADITKWENGVGVLSYDDFYIASFDELQQIYINRTLLNSKGASVGSQTTWSSTEVNNTTARAMNLLSGGVSSPSKSNEYDGAIIRDFISSKEYAIGDKGQIGWVFYKEVLSSGTYKNYEFVTMTNGRWTVLSSLLGANGSAIGTGKSNTQIVGLYADGGFTAMIKQTYERVTNIDLSTTHIQPKLSKGIIANTKSYFKDDINISGYLESSNIKVIDDAIGFKLLKADGITPMMSVDTVNDWLKVEGKGIGINTDKAGPYDTSVVINSRAIAIVGAGTDSALSNGQLFLGNNRSTLPSNDDECGGVFFFHDKLEPTNPSYKRTGYIVSFLKDDGSTISSDLAFATKYDLESNPSTKVTIKGNGNVGIGTTTPNATLEIEGSLMLNTTLKSNQRLLSINLQSDGVNGSAVRLFNDTDPQGQDLSFFIQKGGSGIQHFLHALDGENSYLCFGTDSKLGIGTSSPDARLSIWQENNTAGIVNSSTPALLNLSNGIGGNILYINQTAGNSTRDWNIGCASSGNPSVNFINPASGVMNVTVDGNVGIGTTAPESALVVVTNDTRNVNFDRYEDSAASSYVVCRKARGTQASPTGILANDFMGVFGARAHNGTDFTTSTGTYLLFQATENWTSTNNGTSASIFTIPNGSTVGQRKFSVNHNGEITAQMVYSTTVTSARDVQINSSGLLGYTSSTKESKNNINYESDSSWIYGLKKVTFEYRLQDEEGNYLEDTDNIIREGFIAEDVNEVKPEMCYRDDDGTLRGIDYKFPIPAIVDELKKRRDTIDKQQVIIDDLIKRLEILEGGK